MAQPVITLSPHCDRGCELQLFALPGKRQAVLNAVTRVAISETVKMHREERRVAPGRRSLFLIVAKTLSLRFPSFSIPAR